MAAERRSRREWRALVDQWQCSGQTCTEFARRAGVNPSTLAWWRWKLGTATERSFLEVVVEPVQSPAPTPTPSFGVEVGGLLVRVPVGFDAGELRRLVEALC